MFWAGPNTKDLLAWTRCPLMEKESTGKHQGGSRLPDTTLRVIQSHKMYFIYSLENQGISLPHGLLYRTGHTTKTKLCERLNQCKLSVYPFLNKFDKAVRGSFRLEVAYYKALAVSSLSWPRVNTSLQVSWK